MRTVLSRVSLLFLSVVCSVSAASIDPNFSPACGTNTLDSYLNLANGCTLVSANTEFTLKDVSYSVLSGSLRAEDVWLNPMGINGLLQLGLSSPSLSVGAGERLQFKFGYVLDPPPPILEDLSMDLDANSPYAPGFATIEVDICAGGVFSPDGCAYQHQQFILYHYGDGDVRNVLSDRARFAPTNIVDVRMLITLDGGPAQGGGSSQINGFSTTTFVVPEPGSALLMASALGFAVLASRRFQGN